MNVAVVIPARDEEARIGRCLRALGDTPEAGRLTVVVVLDGCRDGTAGVVEAHRWRLPGLWTVPGPGRGPGRARREGMRVARARLGSAGGLLLSTDADTRVARDWVTVQVAAARAGAQAVGGRILLDAGEARALPKGVVDARRAAAIGRLARVRCFAPEAEHHHFSGASLAMTTEVHDRVGGIPDVETLEDEALETALRRAGVPIHYLDAVRVTTSARTDGRARRGLADALAAWAAAAPPVGAAPALPTRGGTRVADRAAG